MFRIGDTVVHPGYGAGTVVGIERLKCLSSDKPYYAIELSDGSRTHMWVPVGGAGERGVRHLTPKSQLSQIWSVLRAGPETLPPDHGTRYELVQEKLRGGDIFRVAEVVRDMFWENHRSRRLSVVGKELYEKGLTFLTSEVALVQGCDLTAAGDEISSILGASLAANPAVG
jgi:CarD family transcriptional regulator